MQKGRGERHRCGWRGRVTRRSGAKGLLRREKCQRLWRIANALLSVLAVLLAKRRRSRVALARVGRRHPGGAGNFVSPDELHWAGIRRHRKLRENHSDDAEQADQFAGEAVHDGEAHFLVRRYQRMLAHVAWRGLMFVKFLAGKFNRRAPRSYPNRL